MLGRQPILILQTGEMIIHNLAFGDLQRHTDQLSLDELLAADRHAELNALTAIGQRRIKAGFSRSHSAPGNTKAGLIQTGEWGAMGAPALHCFSWPC